MNSKEISQLVIHYICNSKLKNAILINGVWGSGKTFFVNSELIPVINNLKINKESRKTISPIYISLYGIEKASDISKEVFNKTILFGKSLNSDFKGRKKYALEVTKGTAKSLVKGLLVKYLGIEFSMPAVDDYWDFIDETEIVLILDDLERAQIEITQLLGYINNFVEEYGIKTIIVGNEEEIKKRFRIKNQLEKYQVVKNLELPIGEKKSDFEKRFDKSTPTNINPLNNVLIKTGKEELDKKVAHLFPEPSNYEDIKEKLIGFTIEYEPNLKDVFGGIAIDYLTEKEVQEIVYIFENKNCLNIRTFLFGFEMFEKVKTVFEETILNNKDFIKSLIMRTIFSISIKIKERKDELSDYFNLDFSFSNVLSQDARTLMKQEVEKFLNTSIIDKEKLIQIFNYLDMELTKSAEKQVHSLSELQVRWLLLEDYDLTDRLKRAIDNVLSGKVDIRVYKTLVTYIYYYNIIFEKDNIDINPIINSFLDNISKSKDFIDKDNWFNDGGVSFAEQSIIDEINEQFKQINNEVKKTNAQLTANIVKTDSVETSWVEDIIVNIPRYSAGVSEDQKSIFGYLSISKVLNNIKQASIREVTDFYYKVLKAVYSFDNINQYYSNDLEAISELSSGMKNIREEYAEVKGKSIYSHVLKQTITFVDDSVIPKLNA